jgi:hypothetical protein
VKDDNNWFGRRLGLHAAQRYILMVVRRWSVDGARGASLGVILKRRVSAVMGAGLLFFSVSVGADIYKYEDRHGKLYFTDRPMKGSGYRLLRHSTSGKKKSTDSRIDMASSERNRRRYTPMIEEVARKVRLRPELLHAVVKAESAYDPRALSRTGARGLMQLMPGTAKRYGVYDSWDPKSNLIGGATYLRDLLLMFNNDLHLALAAYNAGENAVKRFGNSIPPYPETEAYVTRVLDLYRENQASGRVTALN